MGKGKKKGGGGQDGGDGSSQGQGSSQRQDQPHQGQQQRGRPQQGQQQGGRPQQGQQQGGRPDQGQQQGGRPQHQQGQQQGGRPQHQHGQQQGGRPQQGQHQGGRPQQGQHQGERPQQGQYQGGRPQQGQYQGGRPQQGQQQGGRPQKGQHQGGRPQQGQQSRQGGQGAWGQPQSQPQQSQGPPQSAWGKPAEQPQGPPQSAWGKPAQQQQQPQLQKQAPPEKDTSGVVKSMEQMSVSSQQSSGSVAAKGDGAHVRSAEPSRPPSVASSAGGDVASVKSGGSGAQQTPKKAPGGLDKKSLTDQEKNRLMSLIPRRKNPKQGGTKGRRIEVFTNMVQIFFDKSKFKNTATHYDVKFDPDKPKFLKRLAFNKLREQNFPNNWPAFDGRVNVYSAGDLPFGRSITQTVEVFDEEQQRNRPVVVTMEKVNVIDMSWLPKVTPGFREEERDQTSIQVLDVVLRMAQFNRAIPVGRSFFQQPKSQSFDLTDGMELWVGMFQSAVLGWKPYFNVDVAHKAFPKNINVIDAMKDLCGDRYGPLQGPLTTDLVERNKDKIFKFLKGLKVVFQLPNKPTTRRTVGVNGLDKPADKAVFSLDNGQQTTVATYFAGSKGYRLQRPDLPCLWVGSRNKHVLLPPELCTIAAGLVTNRKLNDEQTRKMIREAAKPAPDRKRKIEETLKEVNFAADPTMREFGLSLNGQLEKVDARVLDPPALEYKDNKNTRVMKGVWRASEFLNAQNIPDGQWTILNLSRCQEGNLREFVSMLQGFGKTNGMKIGNPHTPFEVQQLAFRNPRDVQSLKNLLDNQKNKGMKLVVVVLPGFPADVYARVKQQAELYVGILTQCVKEQTINKCVQKNDKSTAGNILLKINAKLNGVNHTFSYNFRPPCLSVPAIIIGADVTHPSPDATDIPSIAAVAASYSFDVFKYNIEIKLQPARQEIILQLEQIVYNQLKIFAANAGGRKPEKIFYYRDGVSEGQFPQVMHFELQAIRNACRKFGQPEKYEPKITFLVVQKRHHIRLFPANPRNSDDRGGNVQAGTIVDTQITHPSHIDFYLVSHASIQGTARPTKYRCLWDDNDMSEDDIETLTYYLCHMFSRCTRSVSYPAPTYYAHLAAFRARALINGVPIQMDNLDREQLSKLTLRPELVNGNPMFFV